MSVFTTLAMMLDTLPAEGRVLLLAVLLTGALYGFSRVLPDEVGSSVNVLYRKGALLALVLVPAAVYLFNIQVPVPVEEVVRYDTRLPGYVAYALLVLWALGSLLHLLRLGGDLRSTFTALHRDQPGADPEQLESRLRHWLARLNLKCEVRLVCTGAEQAWHVRSLLPGRRGATVVLPAAALNWPAGVVDALLLSQLAQLYQGSWRWLVFGRLVQVFYWPLPWVGTLVQQLAEHMLPAAIRLARAAYRDPEGWQRDLKNLNRRGSTLTPVPMPRAGALLRLPNSGTAEPVAVGDARQQASTTGDSFESKWAGTKRRRRAKVRDPYEQVYWLIAVASIMVGIASTLTLVQAPPEFDPQHLNVKWQDKMMRRLWDFDEGPPDQTAPQPPRRNP